ncbi:serpin B5-like [Uranotaenia lowii]|uniref:serpin B5-like n=1 Tax=Uranotaenia lowii TaxID=190385 RepID=UPI00247A3211|nr:serpin B5-like [Uranotaenia lowii]
MILNGIPLALIASLMVSMATAAFDASQLKIDYQGEFSWTFLGNASNGYKDNIVVSPYSIRRLVTSLTNITERSNGITNELRNALNLMIVPAIQQRYYEQMKRLNRGGDLIMGSSLVVYSPNAISAGLSTIANRYGLKLVQTSDKISAFTPINSAISELTKGKVIAFTNRFEYDFWPFSLMDYMQYSGLWKYNFNGDPTVCHFYTDARTKTLSKFVTVEAILKYGSFSDLNLKAVELPLAESSALSCIFLLPLNKQSLNSVMKNFNHNNFRDILKGLTPLKTLVTVPEFEIQSTTLAKNVLKSMGLPKAFDEKIYKIYQDGREQIGEIIHKAKFTMHGNGTMDTTGEELLSRDMGKQFLANQPFVYVIFERTESMPVLMGHFMKPTEKLPKTVKESTESRCQVPPFEGTSWFSWMKG